MEAPWLPPPKKFKISLSAEKVMASVFWDNQGVIMVDYHEEDRMINGAYSAEDLRRLRQQIVRKRKGKLTQGVLFLLTLASCHVCCD